MKMCIYYKKIKYTYVHTVKHIHTGTYTRILYIYQIYHNYLNLLKQRKYFSISPFDSRVTHVCLSRSLETLRPVLTAISNGIRKFQRAETGRHWRE